MSGLRLMAVGLFVLVMILSALMRASSKGSRKFQEGHVTGVVGRKGHGKTLFAVHEMLRHIGNPTYCRDCSTEAGKTVRHRGSIATNGNLNLPAKYADLYRHVDTWEDLLDLPHSCLVVIDEAHLWAPASQGSQLPPHVRWLLSQCRKLHIEIVWVSQRESRVTVGLRDQTDELAICKKSYFKQMSVKFFEPELARVKGEKPAWTYRYRVTKKLARSYNTYELLKPEGTETEGVNAHDVVTQKRQEKKAAGAQAKRAPNARPADLVLTPESSAHPDHAATASI